MRSTSRAFVTLFAIATSLSCGYFLSGVWDDDPENWNRAFHSVKPADVVVVHSRYWRAPHFTFEGGYYFEIEPNEALRNQLFTENRLRKLTHKDMRTHGDAPLWFAPKSLDAYEIWGYADEQHDHFRVLIDRQTGRLFLSDYQV